LTTSKGASRRPGARALLAWVAVGAVTASLAAPPIGALPAGAAVPGTPRTPIEHIVFVLKENRSFDHYFGRFPGVDGATTAKCYDKADPGTVHVFDLKEAPDPMPQDVSHANSTFYTAYHRGAMDGFCHENGAIVKATGRDIADTQMYERDIPNYWAYAKKYGLGDRMFASWRGASFGNNVFAVAAQTGRYDPSIGRKAIFGNPQDPSPGPSYTWGCDNGTGTRVTMIDLAGALSTMFPCYGFKTIPNLLDEYGLSWRFYGTQEQSHFVHSGIAAIDSIRCAPGDTPPCEDPNPYWDAHVKKGAQFMIDAANGNLPAVSWFLPKDTEHAPKTACRGENSTVEAANAVMNGADWSSTAMVIWWDEWGGFYDHVKPPTAKGIAGSMTGINKLISYGFRVPLLVISPWVRQGSGAKGGYVSHAFYSHASFARFVEWAFNLPTLGATDDLTNYTATEPKPGNLSDFFDFSSHSPPKNRLALTTRTCPTMSGAQRLMAATMDPD
jgi:phospholipase C